MNSKLSQLIIIIDSVPPGHGQAVVVPFGHEHLVDVDVANLKGRCTAAQVQIPHPYKGRILPPGHLFVDLAEVLVPAQKGPAVMAAETFHIQHPEIRIIGMVDQFPKGRQGAPREDVFPDPGIGHHFIVAGNGMEQEDSPCFSRWFTVSI